MAVDWNDPKIAEQIPINEDIVNGLIEFIPKGWRSAELHLQFDADANGAVSQRVICPETNEGWTVSHQVVEAVLRLDNHRRKFHLPWQSAIYRVRLDQSGEWKVSASFLQGGG